MQMTEAFASTVAVAPADRRA